MFNLSQESGVLKLTQFVSSRYYHFNTVVVMNEHEGSNLVIDLLPFIKT